MALDKHDQAHYGKSQYADSLLENSDELGLMCSVFRSLTG